jgi:non-ribosomal peptide synthase protein (TIGR01720 family)
MIPAAFVYLAELPLNANGKVDRGALPAPEWQRQSGEQEYVAPRTATEEVLCGIWAEVLRVERVGIYDNFFELGGDSILSIQIVAKARQQGLHLTPKQLFEYQEIAELAAQVKQSMLEDGSQETVLGAVPLTPIQQWFFEQDLPHPNHWNQAVVLQSEEPLPPELLERSWRELVAHHDGLRRRYHYEDGEWRQEVVEATEADLGFEYHELGGLEAAEQLRELEQRADELQGSLDLGQGPLVRVAWFGRGAAAGGWLLVIIHHLVVDGVSWRILLEDFGEVYKQLKEGAAVQLPARTSSVKQWSERLQAYAGKAAAEAEYWLQAGAVRVAKLPRDYVSEVNEEACSRVESGSLSEAETQALLQEVPARYQTQITEVLVTGLVEALWKWSGERLVRLALEGHGREAAVSSEVDVTQTVGWFTTLYPVVVDLRQVYETGAALQAVKEQLRRIPERGLGYGVLRYLGDEEVRVRLQQQEEAELSFNYLGQFDQVLSREGWLRAAAVGSGEARYGGGRRRHLLDVTSSVVNGQLQVSVIYSERIHRRETMEKLVGEYLQQLRQLMVHCQQPEAVAYTPSDFPQARLSQRELNQLVNRLGKGKISKQEPSSKVSGWQASS